MINGPAVGQCRVGHSGGAASVASPAKTELAAEIRAPAGGGGDPLAGAGGVTGGVHDGGADAGQSRQCRIRVRNLSVY